jgi:hypothetical protein
MNRTSTHGFGTLPTSHQEQPPVTVHGGRPNDGGWAAMSASDNRFKSMCGSGPCMQQRPPSADGEGDRRTAMRIAARAADRIMFLDLVEVLAFEARHRHCFVHSTRGLFAVDLSLVEIQAALGSRFIRVHRNWLANSTCVRELHRRLGVSWLTFERAGVDASRIRVPVARELASKTMARLLAGTVGLRRWRRAPGAPSRPLRLAHLPRAESPA